MFSGTAALVTLVTMAGLSLVVLGMGALLTWCWVRPVERLRCIQITFIALVAACILQQTHLLPQVSLGWSPDGGERPSASPSSKLAVSRHSPQLAANHQPGLSTHSPAGLTSASDGSISPRLRLAANPPAVDIHQRSGETQPTIGRWAAAAVLGVFAVGAGWSTLWLGLGVIRLRKLRQLCEPAPRDILELLDDIRASRRRVTLLISPHIEVPLTFGPVRAVIVLPAAMISPARRSALRHCLAHEWSHICNHDVAWWWALHALQPLLWYQPLYWILRRELRLCQDQVADHFAARATSDRVAYAELLLELAEMHQHSAASMALTMSGGRSNLFRRIQLLLSENHRHAADCRSWVVGLAAAVLVAVAAALGTVNLGHAEPPASPAQQTKQTRQPATGANRSAQKNFEDADLFRPDHAAPAAGERGDLSEKVGSPKRLRPDTPAGRLLDKLEELNASSFPYHDPWLRTLKAIVDLGPKAVPELITELDATEDNTMLRCCGFAIRAIGDKRAVPSLIRAIPKTLFRIDGDYGSRSNDADLLKWAQLHDLDASNREELYGIGRPVREILAALSQLTDQKMDEEGLWHVSFGGTELQSQLKRELFARVATKWADWWEQHAKQYVQDPAYTHVNLPQPPAKAANAVPAEAHYKTCRAHGNCVLESVFNPKANQTFYDLDTGRVVGLPEKWRKVTNLEPLPDEILAWATHEGFDLMGTRHTAPDGQAYYVLRGINLQAWELGQERWKKVFADITVEALQAEGRPNDGLLLHFDEASQAIDPEAVAPFLYITRQGTPGMLFVGIEVNDDRIQFGIRPQGERELDPVANSKGRRFAQWDFEEVK